MELFQIATPATNLEQETEFNGAGLKAESDGDQESLHGAERGDNPYAFLAFTKIIKQAIPCINKHLLWKLPQE